MSDMKWRTEVMPDPLQTKIAVNAKCIFAGSCFAENLGAFLQQYKFNVLVNPTGIIFNPIAIANTLKTGASNTIPSQDRLFNHVGLWRHPDVHSNLAHPNRDSAWNLIENAYNALHQHFTQSSHIAVTFGTAWVYKELSTGKIVANNHKLPAAHFTKQLLSVNEIVNTWQPFIAQFPEKQWIFTVSPVRHTRDGMSQNARSKAILIESVNQLAENNNNVYYFPAYEIMMDDLRDYRFYEQDLIHPNQQALQYIRSLFVQTCLDDHAAKWMAAFEPIIAARNHRPLFPDSQEHAAFKKSILLKLESLKKEYPTMNIAEELDYFAS